MLSDLLYFVMRVSVLFEAQEKLMYSGSNYFSRQHALELEPSRPEW